MGVSPGYKQTEIGVIPEDWEVQKIRSLCKIVNGRGFKPHEWGTRGYPIIRIQNLNGSDEFNFYEGPFNPKILVESGQLLFAWSGSRGTSFGPHVWHGETAVLNYHTWKIEVDEHAIDPDFYLHALKNLTVFIEDQAHGASALVHTQKWEMEGFDLAIPSQIKEQRAIAAALSDVDAALAGILRLIAKKRDLKQAAMQTLLTGQARLPGFSGEWTHVSLLDAVMIVRGQVDPKQEPFRSMQLIGPEHIEGGNGRLLSTSSAAAQRAISGKYQFQCGDLIYGKINPHLQKVALAPFGGICSADLYPMRLKNGFSARFLLAILLGEEFTSFAVSQSARSGIPKINRDELAGFIFRAPSQEEQSAIAAVLADMEAEIAALTAQADKTRLLKQAMMQELLTGRTRLPPLEDSHA